MTGARILTLDHRFTGSGPLGCLAISAVITAFAFFAPGISFGFALLPFAFAIVSSNRMIRLTCVAGYFGWVAIISGWGLVSLGHPVLLVMTIGGALTTLLCVLMVRLGIGLTCLILLPLHFVPGNPLLATGTVFPAAGPMAIFVLAILIVGIEQIGHAAHRAAALLLMVVLGNLAGLAIASFKEMPRASEGYQTIDITGISAFSERGYNQVLGDAMQVGGTYITGENIIQSDNTAAIAQWCRIVRARDLTVWLGVQNAGSGQAQLWAFDAEACRIPQPLYAARTGIPWITGHFAQMEGIQAQDAIGFLACFEGFSVWRWLEIAKDNPQTVVTFAKDYWTEPLQVGRLRRKIARQFERLLSVPSFHAEAGKTLLMQVPNDGVSS